MKIKHALLLPIAAIAITGCKGSFSVDDVPIIDEPDEVIDEPVNEDAFVNVVETLFLDVDPLTDEPISVENIDLTDADSLTQDDFQAIIDAN